MKLNNGKVYVFGSGGHSVVVLDALERMGITPDCLFDDNEDKWLRLCMGYEIRGSKNTMYSVCNERDSVVVAIAFNQIRRNLVKEFTDKGIRLMGVRHPDAVISRHAEVAETAQIMAGVVVNPGAKVGNHVILNTGSIVEHDAVIKDFVHIAPGVKMGGAVKINEGTLVGTGSCILPMKTIGSNCTVGAGTVITRDVPDSVTIYGNPGRIKAQKVQN